MEINYYRQPNAQGIQEAWESCQFTSDTDLTAFISRPLVTINGQPILRQHHITYLTRKETCRAHHFAKHLAIQFLNSSKVVNFKDDPEGCDSSTSHPIPSSDSRQASDSSKGTSDRVTVGSDFVAASPSHPSHPSSPRCKLLWIDTLHGPHISSTIYRELAAHATAASDFHFVCLDILGSQRDNVWFINRNIESLIDLYKPELVVIDDIDHFMPHCGVTIATEFTRIVRDALNHSDTAFLFIGYNHLGKKASTTGNLGKFLFMNANDVFTVSTQREITTVRHVSGYDLSCDPDASQFHFTIGSDNLPQEAEPQVKKGTSTGIDDDTLCNIASDIIEPGQSITPSDFLRQVTALHRHLKQQDRATALYNQALRLNLIPSGPSRESSPSSDSSESRKAIGSISDSDSISGSGSVSVASGFVAGSPSHPSTAFNNSLTLPPLPFPQSSVR